MTCSVDSYLGAYVLNALEPDETQSVQAHLTGCQACRDEVDSLAATASLLALLTLQDVEHLYDLEPDGDGRAPARPRRRRAAVAVAVVVLIAATLAGSARVLSAGSGPPPPGIVRVVDPTTQVRAAVTITGRNWGTQLHLSLAGAYPSGWCSLVAHARDGRSDIASTWVADRAAAASVEGVTAIPASQLTELDVVTATGRLVVRIGVPHHSK